MNQHQTEIIDLGDARFETCGMGTAGLIEVQTFLRTYDVGIQSDD